MSDYCPRPRECAECPLWWWGVTLILLVILLVVLVGAGDLCAQTQTVTGDKLRIGPATVTASAAEVRIGEDGSNYCDITISATGQLTLDCTGAGAGYVLPDVLNIQNTISNSAGSVTIDDPLIVTGTSDLRGTIFNTNATVIVDDALGVTGAVDLQGLISNSTGTVTINDNLGVTGTSDLQGNISNSTGSVTINDNIGVAGSANLQGTISNSADNVIIDDNLGVSGAIYANELHVKAFIADLEQALAGGQVVSKSVATVACSNGTNKCGTGDDVAFVCPAKGSSDTLYVRDLPSARESAAFVANDYVALRTISRSGATLTTTWCIGQVTNYTDIDSPDGIQSWTFTRTTGDGGGDMGGGSSNSLDTDIEAFWDLDETGATFDDSVGTTDLSETGSVGYTTGKIGNAAGTFTANTNYLGSTADALNYESGTNNGDFTISAWVYVPSASLGNWNIVATKWSIPGTGYEWWFGLYPSGYPRFVLSDDGTSSEDCAVLHTSAISADTWTMISGGFDNVNNKTWVSIGTGTPYEVTCNVAPTAQTASTFTIGADSGGGNGGYVDNVGFWRKRLSTQELSDLYASGSGSVYPWGGGGGGGGDIAPDTLALDYGVSGDGFYEVNAASGSPYTQVVTWANGTYNGPYSGNRSIKARFGDLNGAFGYSSKTWGTAFGDYGSAGNINTTLDATNGFRIRNNATNVFQIDTSGYVWLPAADHVSDFADTSQLKWSVPSATGAANVSARYYDSTSDVVSLRLYARAQSTGGSADVGQVQLQAYGGGTLYGQATLQTTEGSESMFQLVVTRLELSGSSTGASINDFWDDYVNIADGIEATGAIRERGRTTGMGEWIAVTHNDANFYADTGDHWTVASGDQIAYAYTLVGTTMTVAFQIDQSDIVTSTPTYLQLKVPASKTIQRNAIASVRVLDQSVAAAGFAWAVNGETWIRIYSDMTGTTSGWGTTTDGAYVHGQISFEVN